MNLSVPEILKTDAETYARKAADYAPEVTDPWENFSFSSMFMARVGRGVEDGSPILATLVLIGVKISRMMTLGVMGKAKNEALKDTLQDLRVYLAILEAQLD